MTLLVVACGNPLREDDGLAWRVADACRDDARFEVIAVQQLAPEIADRIADADGVVFVDARRDGRPGSIRFDPIEPGGDVAGFTHFASPEGLLACAHALRRRAPRAALLSTTGARFGHGESLSPVVAAAIPELMGVLRRAATDWRPHGTTSEESA